MKKITTSFMSIMLMVTLATLTACGGQETENTASSSASPVESNLPEAVEQSNEESESPSEASGEDAGISQEADEEKTLVVYYSATGSTEKAAEYIASAANAEIFELKPVKPYSDEDLDWTDTDSRVVHEHENPDSRTIELVENTVPDWEAYDTVFIGYPIWWGIAAWPIDSFIEANDFSGKTVIPFCTSSSSGLGDSGKLLEEAAGTGSWLEGMRFSSGVSEKTVVEWVESLEP